MNTKGRFRRLRGAALVATVFLGFGSVADAMAQEAPPPAQMRATVDAFWTSAASMDVDAVMETFAENVVSQDPYGGPKMAGRPMLAQFFGGLAQSFQTFAVSQDFVQVAGNRVAVKWSAEVVMADGRPVAFEGIDVFEIDAAGKIAEMWGYWDPSVLFASQ